MNAAETILREATFNPRVRTYWLLSGIIMCVLTIVGIAFLPIWLIVGYAVTQRYLDRMQCTLTDRALKVRKGILVRVEKTVPLDKITDVGMVQGPIMRFLDLHALAVETAGQSSAGSLIRMTGIDNAEAFRDAVLQQRDWLASGSQEQPTREAVMLPGHDAASVPQLLQQIRDVLERIDERLARK